MKIDIRKIIKNKKILYPALGVLLIILIIVVWFIVSSRSQSPAGNESENSIKAGKNLPAPEFLTDEEKDSFGLPSEVKAQALNRDSNGKISVYKIIKSDSDIVLDPAAIGPISPHQK